MKMLVKFIPPEMRKLYYWLKYQFGADTIISGIDSDEEYVLPRWPFYLFLAILFFGLLLVALRYLPQLTLPRQKLIELNPHAFGQAIMTLAGVLAVVFIYMLGRFHEAVDGRLGALLGYNQEES